MKRLAICVAAYLALRVILIAVIGDGGVLTPEHAVEGWRVGAALALLVMRLTVLIGAPVVIGYRAAVHFIPRIATRLRAR